jgi:hypothetical protein
MASTTSRPRAIFFPKLHRTADWVAKPTGFGHQPYTIGFPSVNRRPNSKGRITDGQHAIEGCEWAQR